MQALRVYEAVAAADPIDPWAHARIGAMKLHLGQVEGLRSRG